MAYCVIGMTNDEERRKREHQQVYDDLYGWKVLETCETENEAEDCKQKSQDMETRLAGEHGCYSYPGGRFPNNPNPEWVVYKFYTNHRPPVRFRITK